MQIDANTSALTEGELYANCAGCGVVLYSEKWDDKVSDVHTRKIRTNLFFGITYMRKVKPGENPTQDGYECPCCGFGG